MILGPVFRMEMRSCARRPRHFASRVLFALAVLTAAAITRYSYVAAGGFSGGPLAPADLADLGQAIFAAYAVTQFVLAVLVAPLYSGGAIAGDRERKVLEMVFGTPLNNLELIAGKFLVRVFQLCSLLLAGVPVVAFCLLLGGVSGEQLLATVVLTLTMVLFVCSFGLLISIGARRTYMAVTLTYLLLLLAWMGPPVIAAIILADPTHLLHDVAPYAMGLNPAVGIMSIVESSGLGLNLRIPAHWMCVGLYGVATVVLMIVNVGVVRRLGLWASRERVVREKPTRRVRRARTMWSNPVAWREVKTIAVHRRMRWARIVALIFCVVVTVPLWGAWLDDWLRGYGGQDMDRQTLSTVVGLTAVITWILMTLLASVGFAHERDHQTLDALLTTPLSGWSIVIGKLTGVLRSTLFAAVFPFGFACVGYWHGVIGFRALLLVATVLVIGSLLMASWGLFCSVRFGASARASGLATLAALVLCVFVPLLTGAFHAFLGRTSSRWIPVTFVSPTVNIDWAVVDNDWRNPGRRRRNVEYRDWRSRLPSACVHLLAEVGLAAGLLSLCVRSIETDLRIRPRRAGPSESAEPVALSQPKVPVVPG